MKLKTANLHYWPNFRKLGKYITPKWVEPIKQRAKKPILSHEGDSLLFKVIDIMDLL